MTQYNPDDPSTIREVFSLEGDALRRAGFQEPDTSTPPEDYTRPLVAAKPPGGVAMKAATLLTINNTEV